MVLVVTRECELKLLQCVVLCGASEQTQCCVNNYCRHQDPPIKVYIYYKIRPCTV